MMVRKRLESLRTTIRELKWEAVHKPADLDGIAKRAAWCADYISELLETLDNDIILKTNVSRECVVEVRANPQPSKAKDIDVLIKMLQLTKSAFDPVEHAEIEPERERDDS